MSAADPQHGRLVWSCRRGMKELDVLLTTYLGQRWPAASASEKSAFEQLLELPDPSIAAMLLGNEHPVDPALTRLVDVLRQLVRPPAAGRT
jgi:antitoxin CptB